MRVVGIVSARGKAFVRFIKLVKIVARIII